MGDLEENNRTFKDDYYQANDELLLWKYEWGLIRAIKHEDIMPVLSEIFSKAFGQEEINKTAISDQGRNFLRLMHPHKKPG